MFFTNPLLPILFSVNNLSPDDTKEYLSATTVGAIIALRDYFAEFVSLKNYGYAVEHVLKALQSLLPYFTMRILRIDKLLKEIFEEMCERYGSYRHSRLQEIRYIWFRCWKV